MKRKCFWPLPLLVVALLFSFGCQEYITAPSSGTHEPTLKLVSVTAIQQGKDGIQYRIDWEFEIDVTRVDKFGFFTYPGYKFIREISPELTIASQLYKHKVGVHQELSCVYSGSNCEYQFKEGDKGRVILIGMTHEGVLILETMSNAVEYEIFLPNLQVESWY